MSNPTFVNKLKFKYPIPTDVSIWWGNGLELTALQDLSDLIESCVEELASDILITAYKNACGLRTKMPDDCVTVTSAMLTQNYMFQGNRLVKCTYDKGNNVAFLSYYPAKLTYKRKMHVADLDTLQGDQLIYVLSYVLWKMSDKELQILQAVNMTVDNGTVDWKVLETFRDECKSRYETLKPEILIYACQW